MKQQNRQFGVPLEAILYPLLLLSVMWVMFWAERVSGYNLVELGVRPQTLSSWPGLFFMPLLHAPNDSAHIINNSFPTLILLAALIYYYREIALRVFVISWLFTGLGVWVLAKGSAVHIGMSGVIYALFGFLFISGFFRAYRPLQVISLFVVLLYGSMVWGIFPQKAAVSWEGHLSGLFIGVLLAILYRKKGPQRPKYQYEIEQELGIEPPDLEGIYHARLAEMEAMEIQREELRQQMEQQPPVQIIYHVRQTPPKAEDTPQGGNAAE